MSASHAEVPNRMDNFKESKRTDEEEKSKELIVMEENMILQPGDKVIYACIRVHMDETRTCFPSIKKIKELAHCGQTKVEGAIKRLIKLGFIVLTQKKLPNGKISNFYEFPESDFDKPFEMFTREFLASDLPINIKEYYMDIQKYMYGKDTGKGKIGYSNAKLSELTGISSVSIKKYNDYLIAHGYLEEEPTGKYDQAGFPVLKKNFNLEQFNQAILWAKAVTAQVQENTSEINELKETISDLQNQIKLLNNQVIELNRANALNNIKEVNFYKDTTYPLNEARENTETE